MNYKVKCISQNEFVFEGSGKECREFIEEHKEVGDWRTYKIQA